MIEQILKIAVAQTTAGHTIFGLTSDNLHYRLSSDTEWTLSGAHPLFEEVPDKIVEISAAQSPLGLELVYYIYGVSENGRLYRKASSDLQADWTFIDPSPEAPEE